MPKHFTHNTYKVSFHKRTENKRSIYLSSTRTVFPQPPDTNSRADLQVCAVLIDTRIPLIEFIHGERIGMSFPNVDAVIS
jgi:hypothetical protein